MIMLKRHLVGLYSGVLAKLDNEDLERVKSYAEDVDAVYQIIDPGYQKDRGIVLRSLCEVHKMLAKRYTGTALCTGPHFALQVPERGEGDGGAVLSTSQEVL
jgi:hypothetical protein